MTSYCYVIINILIRNLNMNANFYEKLDDIFDKFMNANPEYFNEKILNMKSEIIEAYIYENNHKGDYIANMLKVKHFRITEDGNIAII